MWIYNDLWWRVWQLHELYLKMEVIYLILTIFLFVVYFILQDTLMKYYYHGKALTSSLATDRFFFIPIIFPNDYFKKETFWEGYITFIFEKLAIILAVYFLLKII